MTDAVQQIKDRISIVDVVGQYVQLRRAGRSYTARCPFHKERTPSFHVSPERGTYMCFGCGEKGDIFTFVEKMDGIDFKTALKQFAEKAGVTLDQRQFKQVTPEEKEHDERLREVCEAAVKYFEGVLRTRGDVQEYLRNRGVHDDTVASWRLGYAPASWDELSKHLRSLGFGIDEIVDAGFGIKSEKRPGEVFDRFRGRIIFPLMDVGGVPIAVSGRFFEKVPGSREEGEPAKYVNSPETALFRKSRVLYGLDKARGPIRKADCILLVEGQFDVVLAHQSGMPFAVALSGTALTQEHLSLLGRLSKRLVLALDADEAGIRSGLKSALMALEAGFDVKVPAFPQGKDPADLARENPELLKAAVRTSKTAVEFFLEVLRPGVRDERAYKKEVEAKVLPLIASMESRIEQEHFIRIVAGKLGVSDLAVRAEVEKHASRAAAAHAEPASPESHENRSELALTALERKAGMLMVSTPQGREWVSELLGEERFGELEARLAEHQEELRHYFDREVHEDTTAEAVAEDMHDQLKDMVRRAKMKSL